jgi:hypothetical protein
VTRYHEQCGESFGGITADDTNMWPSCEKIHKILDDTAISTFITDVMSRGHGGVHTMTAGSGSRSCNGLNDKLESIVGKSSLVFLRT